MLHNNLICGEGGREGGGRAGGEMGRGKGRAPSPWLVIKHEFVSTHKHLTRTSLRIALPSLVITMPPIGSINI